jgi:hypothetical protein
MSYPYIVQGANIVVVIGNKSHTISKTHITYQKVLDAIKAGDWDAVKDTVEPKKVVLNYGRGNVTINGETLLWKGKELNTGLATRMIQMLQEGFPIEPMVLFMENLMSNPSKRSVDELYGFLEKSNLPITPDGCFLAYKKVRADYKDCHSGTMDNSVGQVLEMERNTVDDDKNRTCSAGLHFCSINYLNHFGGERTVIVKINPRDVVSIPSDYNDAKGRTCRYEVIGELNVNPEDAFTEAVQETAVGSQPVVKRETFKSGSSAFYRGYSDGFGDDNFNATNVARNQKATQDYREGYEKGQEDRNDDMDERYRYVPQGATTQLTPQSAWPFPTK